MSSTRWILALALAAVLVAALLPAAAAAPQKGSAQPADALGAYKAAAAEYLATAQEAATKYAAAAQEAATGAIKQGSAYVQDIVSKFSKKDEL